MAKKSGKSGQVGTLPSTELFPEYEQLEPRYRFAIDKRLEFWQYAYIAKALQKNGVDVQEKTVRNWFAKNGPCQRVYDEIDRERAKEARRMHKQANKRVERMLPAALVVMESRLEKGSESAAQWVLETNGVTPIKKIEDVTPRSVKVIVVKPDDLPEGTE